VCCSVLQCVAVCCSVTWSVLQCVAVCCSVLQCVAEWLESAWLDNHYQKTIKSSVLQCVAVCCSELQCVAVCCGVLQSDAATQKRLSSQADSKTLQHTATHCITLQQSGKCALQHTATHCKYCNTLHFMSSHLVSTLHRLQCAMWKGRTATYCNTRQHLQHPVNYCTILHSKHCTLNTWWQSCIKCLPIQVIFHKRTL